jgi:hypothetical protein
MAEVKNEVTPEQAEKFAGYIDKWQAALNLLDWRVIRMGRAKGVMAEVSISTADKMAQYRLGKHFGTEAVDDYTLESTAVHELLHVLLSEYREIAVSKPSDEIMDGAEHRVVHTLERLLVRKP